MITIARNCLLMSCLWLMHPTLVFANEAENRCDHHIAQWLDPASGETLPTEQLFTRLASTNVVLLGEQHTTIQHHRWQSYVLAALHSRNSNMVVGFEMLPRRAQPVLDAFSAGTLTEDAFLEQSEWDEVWGYDADLYLPLFHFARLNRLPTVALNVDRELVSLVGDNGWNALTQEQREGLSDPAPASDAYRTSLAKLYALKISMRAGPEDTAITEPGPEVLHDIKRSDEFSNFVDAQLTWDRAMAEALAAAYRRDPDALVVGIVGRGHLEYGYGIPHQLSDMGIDDVAVLLPLSATDTCDPLDSELATAVFVIDADSDDEPAAARPRLGVIIEATDGGVRVIEVVADSLAAQIGLLKGDVIESAAGFTTETPAALIKVIGRQAPGTWLPLRVLRGDVTHELVARFPQRFDATP